MEQKYIKKSNSTNLSGKRRQISKAEVLYDLDGYLGKMFFAFYRGIKHYHEVIKMYRPESRGRVPGSALNASITQALQDAFPNNWMFGKYKRFILRIENYLIFVKKLDNNNMPMNIKTMHVNTISNQLALPLFDGEDSYNEPILFFGYKKDKTGEIHSPQLVYIDEDAVKWIVSENEITKIDSLNGIVNINKNNNKEADIKIKKKDDRNQASNE